MLQITNLAVGYRPGLAAVRGVDLSLDSGEALALVGESGSGKSTIAKVLLGVLPDGAWATGSAQLDGIELVGRPEAAWGSLRGSRIGIIPQGGMGGLNPVARIETQLLEALALHTNTSKPAARTRARELLQLVHLGADVQRAYPHQLSGGMRQRVAIALALAGEPPLIVADEPTTGLDLLNQERIFGLLAELRSSHGVAMLVISHDLPGVLGVADRIAVMYGGRIAELRQARDIEATCAHPYTRGLLAASASVVPGEPWSTIPGSAPPIERQPIGCRFVARCPLARDECRAVEPSLVTHDSGKVACHRAHEALIPRFPSVARPFGQVEDGLVAEVSGLDLTFRSRGRTITALRGVDLDIRRGEIVGLVGESGSGKTTLGRVLLGLLRPAQGRVLVDGEDLSRLHGRKFRAAQRRVGFVHQDPYGSLHPAMTVRALVAEPLMLAKVPRSQRESRVVDSLSAAGLPTGTDFLDRLPAKLSGGQRQRVAIARALVAEPSLLIADEATSMLDVSTGAGIVIILRRLALERGLAVLFITHDLGEAMHACDRVVVLRAGGVVESGSPADICERPEHSYTAQMLEVGRRRAITGQHSARAISDSASATSDFARATSDGRPAVDTTGAPPIALR